ncbi:MAG: murein biosynthesis integral membrane protein MurJ [Rhizobiaceae bacterium]
MSLVKKFMTVGGATLASRFLGFAREALMAAALGAGPVADAFYAAFRFPNLFRRLFAEGAFNAAFVPLFAKEIEQSGVSGAKKFSEEVLGVLFTALLVLTIAMELSMPLLVRTIIAPGFVSDPQKFNMTWSMALVMFPYLMCMSLTAMMSGILNSLHRYFAAAIAPVFLNIILIGVLSWVLWKGVDPFQAGMMMSWGVLAAGILQLLIVVISVRKAGILIEVRKPVMTPAVKRLLWLAAPAAVAGGITQINLVIGQMIASAKDGAISVLQYADRVYQLPLGVVGVAIGVVLLPELARALKSGHEVEAGGIQNRSIEFALFLTLPAAAALWAISEPIVRVLYERGAFTATTTDSVAGALAIFGLGLPAFVLIKCFTPGFFAREDTKTPMRFAGVSVAVNTALALLLFPTMNERGIATAETVAGWTNAGLLYFTLYNRGLLVVDKGLMRRIPRLVFSAILMGAALYYASSSIAGWIAPGTPILTKASVLLLLVAAAALIYFSAAFLTGGADYSMLKRNLERGRGKPPLEPM